jgi:hypothetical protein
MTRQKIDGFVPIECIELDRGRLMVRFIDLCGTALAEPFFSETVLRLVKRKAPQILVPLSALNTERHIEQPAGFIFHCSRSGSTLIAQALASCAQCRVVSEADVINQLLLSQSLSPDIKRQAVRTIINCFYSPNQPKVVVKFSSWSVVFVDFLRELYPTVPMIFLYRDPVEVLVSWQTKPLPWFTDKTIVDRLLVVANEAKSDVVNYRAKLLQVLLQSGHDNFKNSGLFVNYCQLPGIIMSDFFGLGLTDDNIACMSDRVRYSSKAVTKHIFKDDAQEKQNKASPALLEAHAKYTDAIFQELETLRLKI